MDINSENREFLENYFDSYQNNLFALDPSWSAFFSDFNNYTSIKNPIASVPQVFGGVTLEYNSSLVADWFMKIIANQSAPELTQEQKQSTFQLLLRAELFESFLHMKFVGQKRFSLEGAETLIPMLFMILQEGRESSAEEVVLGMSHRGRLNVLATIFQKPLADIMREFQHVEYEVVEGEGSGDVKYHKGYANAVKGLQLTMLSNPSHLESVDGVATGFTRARQRQLGDIEKRRVVPILIHGDAAISGQGIVYETLELSKLKGYEVGGTIHLIINNHIGFTALPEDSRSTIECSDIAKAFNYPVLHVDAENVESAVWSAIMALQLRQELGIDVFINMHCYRKYGHNESDEPAFTQPLLYEKIRQKKPIYQLFQQQCAQIGTGGDEAIFRHELESAFLSSQTEKMKQEKPALLAHKTVLPIQLEPLLEIAKKSITLSDGFTVHPRIKKNLEEKQKQFNEKKGKASVDFAFAEIIAFGTLLKQKISIRLTGQDSRRGTFSQRHSVYFDQKNGEMYIPLDHIEEGQSLFEVYDSPLSEYATLGFEYGYSVANKDTLVVWEAQFGDFANGAQVIIDQYIASGESKWGIQSNLVLLLPHGYEGQGPEHSSARMERFLQLAAANNLHIVVPTTPAQYYHLLRRQVGNNVPLVVFTPKGLLRHPFCLSRMDELAEGTFQTVIDDPRQNRMATSLLFCQGRIYYDLLQTNPPDSAIIRIEQLYPLDRGLLKKIIVSYTNAYSCFWVQEEPENAGAWSFMNEFLAPFLLEEKNTQLKYIGRERAASPATGIHQMHIQENKKIIESLKNLNRF